VVLLIVRTLGLGGLVAWPDPEDHPIALPRPAGCRDARLGSTPLHPRHRHDLLPGGPLRQRQLQPARSGSAGNAMFRGPVIRL